MRGSSRTRRSRSISTEPVGCGQVSGLPNYSDEDEKDRCRDTGRRAGRRSTGQTEDCCLRLAGKYRDPLSNFQATPARPGRRLAAQARPDQGRRKALSWPGTGFIFSQLPAVHLLLSTSPFLPATGIPSFLPFTFSSSIHLHSIHQRTLASLISQTFKMSPNDNVKVLGMPVSTQCLHPVNPQKNSLAPTAEATNIASFATPSAIDSILDSTANPSWTMPSFSLRWPCAWFLPFGTVCGLSPCSKNSSLLPCESPKQVKAQSLTTIIATALRGGLPEYVSSTIPMPRHLRRYGSVHRGASLAVIPVPSP